MNSTLMKFAALVLGFGLWAALGYLGKVPLDPLIALLQMGLGGLVTHMLQDKDAPAAPVVLTAAQFAQMPAPPIPPGPQTGFASVRMMSALAAIALGLAMFSGCTTTTASLYRGYATDAKAGIQTWDDNAIATIKDVFCAQPYSAIQRHPEIQPGVSALCGQLASGSSIDPAQAQRLLDIAKQLGVTATPAAAASGAK